MKQLRPHDLLWLKYKQMRKTLEEFKVDYELIDDWGKNPTNVELNSSFETFNIIWSFHIASRDIVYLEITEKMILEIVNNMVYSESEKDIKQNISHLRRSIELIGFKILP